MTKKSIGIRRTAAVLVVLITCVPFALSQPKAEKNPAPVALQSVDGPGALVASVDASSPAGQAGVVRGDIILAVNGKDLAGSADLFSAVADAKIGDTLELKVRHGDAERTVSVKLADRNGTPYLGVAPAAGRGLMHWGFGIPAAESAAVVTEVLKDSPAEKAGLKAKDVIESFGGVKLDGSGDGLAALVAKQKPGDVVTLSVRTGEDTARDVSVTLGKNPDKADAAYLGIRYFDASAAAGRGMMDRMPELNAMPGFNRDNAPGFQVSAGVPVSEVAEGSPAAKAGIKAKDIITAIDGVSVNSPAMVANTVAGHRPGDVLELTVSRADGNNGMKEEKISVTLGESGGKAYMGITLNVTMMRGWSSAPRTRQQTPERDSGRSLIAPRQGADI